MKVDYEHAQGSNGWMELRRGIPTASELDALVSPTGEVRKGQGRMTYILRKLAEKLVGFTAIEGGGSSYFMEQGTMLERYARPDFEFQTGKLVNVPGFVTTDDGRFGCSPDGLIKGEECGLEMKCPDAHTHIGYLLDGGLPKDYIAQVQGSMYVTGYQWWYFFSYHQKLPPLRIKVARDEVYQKAIEAALASYFTDFDKGLARLLEVAPAALQSLKAKSA